MNKTVSVSAMVFAFILTMPLISVAFSGELKSEEPPLSEGVRIIELDDAMRERLQLKKGDLLVAYGVEGTTTLYSSKDEKFKTAESIPWFQINEERDIKIKRMGGTNYACWYIQSGQLKPLYYPNPPCPPY